MLPLGLPTRDGRRGATRSHAQRSEHGEDGEPPDLPRSEHQGSLTARRGGKPTRSADPEIEGSLQIPSGNYVDTHRDDVVVERLKAAGAVILGKTNVPELGYSGASYNMIFPPTRNPWNTDRTAGGSSA